MKDALRQAGSLALGSRLKRLSDRLYQQVDRAYQRLDYPFHARWFPVFYLLAESAPRGIVELAQATGLTHPGVIQICRQLEQAGLCRSRRDPEDERRRQLELTARGRQRLAELQPLWEVIEAVVTMEISKPTALIEGVAALEELAEGDRLSRTIANAWYTESGRVEILDFRPHFAADFKRLNIEWLETYFEVEPIDEKVLGDPQTHIVDPGGAIFFARLDGQVVGTCALKSQGDGVYELTKMGVTADSQGHGIGRRLMDTTLRYYRWLEGRQLYLETNSILKPAIALYEHSGFVHQPHRRPGTPYARSDVYMIWEDQDPA